MASPCILDGIFPRSLARSVSFNKALILLKYSPEKSHTVVLIFVARKKRTPWHFATEPKIENRRRIHGDAQRKRKDQFKPESLQANYFFDQLKRKIILKAIGSGDRLRCSFVTNQW